jgi:tetratricopeptide (TPR) repeat protein
MEGKISPHRRAVLDSHFANCSDCRELLALFIKVPEEIIDDYDPSLAPLSDDSVRRQTARVLAFIENDERRHSKPENRQPAQIGYARRREGFYISYPVLAALAMIVCAVAAGAMFWLTRDHRPDAAMDALKLAVKDERRTPARISGGLAYSPYYVTRGEEDSEGIQFQRALNKLKYAEVESAPATARLALARVHLALGQREEAKNALTILEQLVARGHQSAEILNDLGVAQFQLENYGGAIASFTSALEKSSDFTEALFNRALAEEQNNKLDEAMRDWQQFIRLTSDEKWKAEAERHLSRLQSSSELTER